MPGRFADESLPSFLQLALPFSIELSFHFLSLIGFDAAEIRETML